MLKHINRFLLTVKASAISSANMGNQVLFIIW